MKDLNQLILKFDYEQNFKDDDFYVSKSNKHIFSLLDKWPRWEKNFLNISGEKFSGKSHLINIFIKKFKGIKFNSNHFTNEDLKKIKIYENIILENLNKNIDEKLIYSLFNIIDLAYLLEPIIFNTLFFFILFTNSDIICESEI